MNQISPPALRLSWLVWGLGAAFYLIAFYQRVAPAVITEELMSEFRMSAAALCSGMLIAWAVSGPVFGWMSDWCGRRKPFYFAGCLISLCAWGAVLFWPGLDTRTMSILLIVIGLGSGCMIIGFAFAKESVPQHLGGTVSGLVNMGVMLGPMAMQPLVGWVLDLNWNGQLENSVRIYRPEAFRYGFSLPFGWLALSTLLVLFARETGGRQYGVPPHQRQTA